MVRYTAQIGGWLPTASREPRYERNLHFIGTPDGALCGGNVDESRVREHRRWRLCKTCRRLRAAKPRYVDDLDDDAPALGKNELSCMACHRVYRWETYAPYEPGYLRRLFCSRRCRDLVLGEKEMEMNDDLSMPKTLTVGELKEYLDDYGDHLPVVIVVEDGPDERWYRAIEVDTTSPAGEPHVVLGVEGAGSEAP